MTWMPMRIIKRFNEAFGTKIGKYFGISSVAYSPCQKSTDVVEASHGSIHQAKNKTKQKQNKQNPQQQTSKQTKTKLLSCIIMMICRSS